jgi:hypothetical protein
LFIADAPVVFPYPTAQYKENNDYKSVQAGDRCPINLDKKTPWLGSVGARMLSCPPPNKVSQPFLLLLVYPDPQDRKKKGKGKKKLKPKPINAQ